MTDSVLARAQSGDSDAFAELTNPYRRELHVHCYRILGSFQDAEDLLQETLLSAWQGLDRFDGRSLRAWLYRIATNRCLNYLRDSSRRPQVTTAADSGSVFAGAPHSDEPWWIEPYPDALTEAVEPGPEARYDARESIALLLRGRPPTSADPAASRAGLRDVLGFSAAEVAEMLDSTPASVNSALAAGPRWLATFKRPRSCDTSPIAPRSRSRRSIHRRHPAGRSRSRRRTAHRRRQPQDAARALRVPRSTRHRPLPPAGCVLARRPQDGHDKSQQRPRLRLLPQGPQRRRLSSEWDFRVDNLRGPDRFDDPVRRQEPLRLLRPPTHDPAATKALKEGRRSRSALTGWCHCAPSSRNSRASSCTTGCAPATAEHLPPRRHVCGQS